MLGTYTWLDGRKYVVRIIISINNYLYNSIQIRAIGKIITCMERESMNGKMEENMKENICLIRRMDMANICGQMEDLMRVFGNLENRMELDSILNKMVQLE